MIHVFGFANALGDIGLSAVDIPLALLFFNLGVEAGQVAFIGVLIVVNLLITRFLADLQSSAHRGLAYGLGGIAASWLVDRPPSMLLA